MKECCYSDELAVQYVISFLKSYNISQIITSPGATNISFVASVQSDPFFKLYSCVDERSAAYLACGLSEESGLPVVISCTGATASRNYMSGLTEAYYRKLKIIALTSTQPIVRIGSLTPQVIDRSIIPNDIANFSVTLPIIKNEDDARACEHYLNQAFISLYANGGGPIHINLPTTYSLKYDSFKLPIINKVNFYSAEDIFPKISGTVAIFVGSHSVFTPELTSSVDEFCEKYNSVVFCDHTSNYYGKYRVVYSLVQSQSRFRSKSNYFDLMIHIGSVSGAYNTPICNEVWRVNEDGVLRDTFSKLSSVFQCRETTFFRKLNDYKPKVNESMSRFDECKATYDLVFNQIDSDKIPFSNIWVAHIFSKLIPAESVLHLGILNTLRSWNFFDIHNKIRSYCNVGGFGIDGCVSTLIGASLNDPSKLYFGIVGDLAFFYDMNSLGNRHVGNNVRIMIINNGKGAEFTNYTHTGAIFGNDVEYNIAASGHFGNKSPNLIKNYSENLGFTYFSASTKNEFNSHIKEFIGTSNTLGSIIFEIFTDSEDESNALQYIRNLISDQSQVYADKIKNIVGKKNVNRIKKIFGK